MKKAPLEKVLQHFRKTLFDRRTKLNITQVDLAKKTKMSQATIAHLESGRKLPSLETLIKLADALDLSPRSFL